MKHDRFHELLCLRLYGELSPEEERLLTGHLDACAECRAFAGELDETLAAQVSARAMASELPRDWNERLAASLSRERRASWTARALPFLAGLAAGLALALFPRADPDLPAPSDERLARFGDAPPFVLRAEPPPPASSRGALAHIGTWLRR